MRLVARVGTLVVMLLLGQYILVGSGFGCRVDSHADSSLPRSATSMSAHVAPAHEADCGGARGDMSCPLDDMVCSSMAVCGAVVMTADVRQVSAADGLTRVAPLAAIADVATRSIAPEPPPPRA